MIIEPGNPVFLIVGIVFILLGLFFAYLASKQGFTVTVTRRIVYSAEHRVHWTLRLWAWLKNNLRFGLRQ